MRRLWGLNKVVVFWLHFQTRGWKQVVLCWHTHQRSSWRYLWLVTLWQGPEMLAGSRQYSSILQEEQLQSQKQPQGYGQLMCTAGTLVFGLIFSTKTVSMEDIVMMLRWELVLLRRVLNTYHSGKEKKLLGRNSIQS